ncbi:MAG: 4-hydroxybenzoate octaprenyltransferase [Magnetococcales bacterium]|nr:4-hydroxybenzoate octaprenyltransferase [Magnetococcales bacterium]
MMARYLVEWLPWPLARDLLRLMRVDRPIGTWLLLWPALWALCAAMPVGQIDWRLVAIISVGAFVMRSAGCVINDIADRRFDPYVARTRDRPLAAGRVTLRQAIILLIGLLLLALLLALQLNPLCWQLAIIGGLLAVSYPFTKRFFWAPQFYMGVAFGWGAIIAWAAVTAQLSVIAWLIFAATLTWAAGYDTIYAMMDRRDDRLIGIHSTALLFGRGDRLAVAILYGMTVGLLAVVGWQLQAGWFYFLTLCSCAIHMGWQIYAIRGYQTEVLLRVFLSNRWLGLAMFLGFCWRG